MTNFYWKPTSEVIRVLCAHCGNLEITEEAPFPTCGQCSSVSYCSRTCQRQDWSAGHKNWCSAMQEARNDRTAIAAVDAAVSAAARAPLSTVCNNKSNDDDTCPCWNHTQHYLAYAQHNSVCSRIGCGVRLVQPVENESPRVETAWHFCTDSPTKRTGYIVAVPRREDRAHVLGDMHQKIRNLLGAGVYHCTTLRFCSSECRRRFWSAAGTDTNALVHVSSKESGRQIVAMLKWLNPLNLRPCVRRFPDMRSLLADIAVSSSSSSSSSTSSIATASVTVVGCDTAGDIFGLLRALPRGQVDVAQLPKPAAS